MSSFWQWRVEIPNDTLKMAISKGFSTILTWHATILIVILVTLATTILKTKAKLQMEIRICKNWRFEFFYDVKYNYLNKSN